MTAQIAFLTLAEGACPTEHRMILRTPAYDLVCIAVPDYKAAVHVAQELVSTGITLIELCAGFGHQGVAVVAAAVPEACVGAVRFDTHPGLGGKSGDSRFSG